MGEFQYHCTECGTNKKICNVGLFSICFDCLKELEKDLGIESLNKHIIECQLNEMRSSIPEIKKDTGYDPSTG